jgi:LDH2 family malate/lactate/ureidoglycolate dehydrogenase
MPIIQAGVLRAFAETLLTAGGFTTSDAAQTADLLVWANLRGVDSHGVLRIPRYIDMLEQGITTSGTTVETVKEFAAIAVLDGGKCPGAVGMNAAVDNAVGLARKFGLGWVAARNISHAGAIGYFSSAVANQGLVGIVMTASKPLMNYFGAQGEALSTNPLSIAIPTGVGVDPIVLDMSTAAVALGKIMAAKDAGQKIPEGWGTDKNGAATTDPHDVAALLPMADAKGSGLSLMIEMLTSVLAGNAIIGPVLTGLKKGGFNGLVLAINPAAFGNLDEFAGEVARLSTTIHNLTPVQSNGRVLLPGERGANRAQDQQKNGISLTAGTAKRLVKLAKTVGVDVPVALG